MKTGLVTQQTMLAIMAELPSYRDIARRSTLDIDDTNALKAFKVVQFWKAQPALFSLRGLVRKLMIIPTSSACIERAFSTLNNHFNDQQVNTSASYRQLAVMLAYNHDHATGKDGDPANYPFFD